MSNLLPAEPRRILDADGAVVGEVPIWTAARHRQTYRAMLLGRVFSDRMVALQRQGRMGTFAPLKGQEASAGVATSLGPEDWLIGSYREAVPMFVKGLPLQAVMETTGGRFGVSYTREHGVLPMQIVLATQMLHAVGIAMGIRYDDGDGVVVGICGDGATSEGDFNEALNFAGVFQAPVVLVVQNNGWAISVPRHKQTAAQYIAHRGPAFGVPAHLVDGNDVLAVDQVMSECVERARAGGGPSLVEMLTYRMDAHTTADDPTRYQPPEEVAKWQARDPLRRYRRYLLRESILTDEEDEALHEAVTAEIQAAVEAYESRPAPDPLQHFDYVYETPTSQMEAQRRGFEEGQDG